MRIPTGIGKPHPLKKPHGTLFNLHVVSLLVPMISLGATLATLVARVIPDLYIVIIYFGVLSCVLVLKLQKLKALIAKETAARALKEAETKKDSQQP